MPTALSKPMMTRQAHYKLPTSDHATLSLDNGEPVVYLMGVYPATSNG